MLLKSNMHVRKYVCRTGFNQARPEQITTNVVVVVVDAAAAAAVAASACPPRTGPHSNGLQESVGSSQLYGTRNKETGWV